MKLYVIYLYIIRYSINILYISHWILRIFFTGFFLIFFNCSTENEAHLIKFSLNRHEFEGSLQFCVAKEVVYSLKNIATHISDFKVSSTFLKYLRLFFPSFSAIRGHNTPVLNPVP